MGESEVKESKFSQVTVKYVSIFFGLMLVIFSVYQIYQSVDQTNQLDKIESEIALKETTKKEIQKLEIAFHDLFLELLALDYQLTVKLDTGNITVTEATLQMEGFARRFWALQDLFRSSYFMFKYGENPDGIRTPWYEIKPEYKWLIEKNVPVKKTIWMINNDTGEWEERQIEEKQAIVLFKYLAPIDGIDYRRFYDIESYDSEAIDPGYYFVWNKTSATIFNQTWTEPLDITFREDIFIIATAELYAQQESLAYRIQELETSLVINSVALLLLGFLIDVKDKRVWRNLYLIVALFLTSYSIFGQDLMEWMLKTL